MKKILLIHSHNRESMMVVEAQKSLLERQFESSAKFYMIGRENLQNSNLNDMDCIIFDVEKFSEISKSIDTVGSILDKNQKLIVLHSYEIPEQDKTAEINFVSKPAKPDALKNLLENILA